MSKEISLLMVEDSESDAVLLVRELERAGYRVQSKRVVTAADFSAHLESQPWDIILCDYSVPGFNGLAALRIFNEHRCDIPFIFVSGTISEDIAVAAMKTGAHDYVMKSNLKRLVPAVEREMRDAGERREKNLLVDQRRKIEEEMRRKDALYRTLIQHSSDGILLLDEEGNLLYMSPSATEFFGGETVPQNFFHLIHEGVIEAGRHYLARLAASPGEILTFESRMRRSDGSWRWIEAVGHNMLLDETVGAIVINYRDITDRKVAEEEVRQSRERLRALAANLQNAREEERRHISREFHDVLGQSLTAVKMGLTLLQRELTNGGKTLPKKSVEQEIASMQAELEHASHSVRKALSKLRPELLDQLGLVAALSWDADRFQKKTGIRCVFSSSQEEIRLDPGVSIALFRIYQESMTNVVRHSQATRVEIALRVEEDRLTMTIHDNGIGFGAGAEAKPDSLGLIGMRERALLLDGTFEIRSKPGEGTAINVSVPLHTTTD